MIITILLVVGVVVATEALMGVGVKQSGPTPIENTMNSLVAISPVGINIPDGNSSGRAIPSSVDMVSGSLETVQNSLVSISPIGLDMGANNTPGTESP